MKWGILTDPTGEPLLVLNADGFLREALLEESPLNPYAFCHRPIVVKDVGLPLGEVLGRWKVHSHRAGDDVIDQDIILLWGEEKRIITGADILGRLLRGIAAR